MTDQIRLRTLLKEDEFYRIWFGKPPTITTVHSTPPWRLFVQRDRDGRWARKDFPAYSQAYEQVRLRLPDVWDMAIHCRPQGFKPPLLKIKGVKRFNPMPPDHVWCYHCRRPTIFLHYVKRHPNLGAIAPDESSRCFICGIRRTFIPEFPTSTLSWPVVG